MQYLLDTGVLLRLVIPSDAMHVQIRRSIGLLKSRGHRLLTTSQNISEFWNVCTRPATARGGRGLSPASTYQRLKFVERAVSILPDRTETYQEWKKLVVAHSVVGVQVHGARMVAAMLVHGVGNLLTLNTIDFKRYASLVTAVKPAEIAAAR
jgi:predicted nucleic acid-binding protein